MEKPLLYLSSLYLGNSNIAHVHECVWTYRNGDWCANFAALYKPDMDVEVIRWKEGAWLRACTHHTLLVLLLYEILTKPPPFSPA